MYGFNVHMFYFYHEVLLASMFTNLHNSEHLKYFIPQYSPLFQNKAYNPTRVNPGLPSGLTRGEMGTSNPEPKGFTIYVVAIIQGNKIYDRYLQLP